MASFLGASSWAVAGWMALAALIVGYSKTALGGLASVAVAIFASIMPARSSTGALLAVLIVGDLVACWNYRRDADWRMIRRLLPFVLPGFVIGSVFLRVVDDSALRRTIGLVLLALILLQLLITWRGAQERVAMQHSRTAAVATGAAAGFATMTANAAGAVMTLYLSAADIDKRRFVGTAAWFFLIINAAKVPFSAGLGLLSLQDVVRAVGLAPCVLIGGVLGYATVARMSQRRFDVAVLLASGLAAVAMLA